MNMVSKKVFSAFIALTLVLGFAPTAWADTPSDVADVDVSSAIDTPADSSQGSTDEAQGTEQAPATDGAATNQAGAVEEEAAAQDIEGADPVVEEPQDITALAKKYRGAIAEGTYLIASTVDSSKCFDVASGSTDNGAKVQLYGSNGTTAQRWDISYDEAGFATIKNVKSGKVLDVAGGKSAKGTKIQQYSSNGSKAQKWVIVPNGNGYTVLSALGDNIALDATGGKSANGTAIQIYTSNGTAAQSWSFTSLDSVFSELDAKAAASKGLLNDGNVYYVETALTASKVLDITSGSTANGAALQLYSLNMTAAQQWKISYDEKGYATFTNVGSGKVLDVSGGSTSSGAKIQQYTSNGSKAQKWVIEKNDDGTFSVLSALWPNLTLDCVSGKSANGTKIQTYKPNGSNAQKWKFVNEDDIYAALDAKAAASKSDLADGQYVVSSSVDNSSVLDVAAGSTAEGTNVQMWESTMAQAQQWKVEHGADGYATITSVKSGKALTVSGGSGASGTNVEVRTATNSRACKWVIEKNDDGTYTLYSALWNGIVLDVSGGSPKNGANVQIYSSNNTGAQKFQFFGTSPKVEPCNNLGIDDKYFTIASAAGSSYVLDVVSGSTSDGANVQVYASNGSYAQTYRLKFVADGAFSDTGYYQVICSGSDMALAVDRGNVVNGANIVQHTANSSDNSQLFSITKNSDGTYTFTNKAAGLAMQTASATPSNNTNINGITPSDSIQQKFTLSEKTDLLPEGYVIISTALKSSMVVDVKSGSTADGANVQLYTNNKTQAQKWYVQCLAKGSNTYTIQSINSGMNLAVSGSNVVQKKANGSDGNQQWKPEISKGKTILKNVATGKVLDVANGSATNGANIQVYSSNGSNAQLFTFTSTDLVVKSTYYIKPLAASSMVLDVQGGKTSADGTGVQLYTKNDTGAQKWKVEKNSDGTYSIKNAVANKALELSGTNVRINSANGSANQKWIFEYCAGGGIMIKSKADSSIALTVSDSGFAKASKIVGGAASSAKTQRFTFEQTTYIPANVGSSFRSMYLKAYSYASSTDYLIMIDRGNHLLGVFKGNRDDWSMIKQLRCTVGKPSTPTPVSITPVCGKYYYNSHSYYRTQFFYNQYGIHSVLHSDAELGQSSSNGCVRINRNEAIWCYSNIPIGTTVVVYN